MNAPLSNTTSEGNRFGWLLRWIDTHAVDSRPIEDGRADWLRVFPFLLVHLACLMVLWVGWSWPALIVAACLYLVRMFAITGFYHRYFSHRTFRTSRLLQFFFAFLGATSAQRGPLWWAAHHRHHHRHSDEEPDRHSPHQHGFLWSHMGWFTSRSAFTTDLKAVPDLARYPELVILDRFDSTAPLLMGGFVYLLGSGFGAAGFQTSGLQMLVWGFLISTVVLFHATCMINSLAHTMGQRRFPTQDESRNNPLLALITLGEGWHNNHHYYPGAARQGFYWWELDITYYALKVMSWLGLIWDLHPVPRKVLELGRRREANS